MRKHRSAIAAILIALCAGSHEARATEPHDYLIYVSNERSGDVTIIDGQTNEPRRDQCPSASALEGFIAHSMVSTFTSR